MAESSETHTFAFEAFPGRSLRVALFRDVENGSHLAERIRSSSLPHDVALINAALVVSPFALHLAAHKALARSCSGGLTTRTVHSELVFNCSPTNHITESLKRFGVAPDSAALLVARFDGTHEEFDQVCTLVQGTRVPLSHLDQLTDAAAVQKAFKPTAQELGCGTLHDAVVCRLATKEVS